MSEVKDDVWLNFSQQNGLQDLPALLKPDELDRRARNILFAPIYSWLMKHGHLRSEDNYYTDSDAAKKVISDYYVYVVGGSITEVDAFKRVFVKLFKNSFNKERWNIVFDMIRYFTSYPSIKAETKSYFIREYEGAFKAARIPYIMTDDGHIHPILSEHEKSSIIYALQATSIDKYRVAREHLHKAADYLLSEKFVDSVRESIHAVEAVGRIILNNPSAKVSELMRHCHANSGLVDGQLKEALVKLNAFADNHARHSDRPEPIVERPEAALMYGSCASFVTYLITKLGTD